MAKNFWSYCKKIGRRIVTERSSPLRLGFAVALGVFIGVLPLYGLHLALCIVFATLFGLNRAVTYLAANISLPWVVPFLLFTSAQLGHAALHGEWLALSMQELSEVDPWEFGQSLVLGSMLLGLGLGVPAGVITYFAASAYRRRHPELVHDAPPLPASMLEVAARYKPHSRFAYGYVQGKFKHDPAYRQLLEGVPMPGPIVDLGCGRGQTAALLALLHSESTVLAIDWDGPKLALARKACAHLGNLGFEEGDIRECDVPESGTVLMIDVLHYNDLDVQDRMIRRAARAVLPGGRLYIRDLDANGSWRARLGVFQERLGCFLRFNRGNTLCFRPMAEVVRLLQEEGLTVDGIQDSAAEYIPLANVLLCARRLESV